MENNFNVLRSLVDYLGFLNRKILQMGTLAHSGTYFPIYFDNEIAITLLHIRWIYHLKVNSV